MILNGTLSQFMFVACGYDVSDDKIHMLNEYLDSKKCTRIDLHYLLSVLTYLKELELMNEKETEGDEYCNSHWKSKYL